MRLLLLCALAASWCLTGHAQSPAVSTRTCNLNNGNNGCLKYDELTSWLQFCPYYGQDSSVDGTDSGCIAIKPLRISETSSVYGELPLRDSASGLRLRPDGSATVKRFDKNCSTSPYFACLPDDGSQAPIVAYSLPLRMDLPQGGSIRLKAFIFGSSGVLQYGSVRHTIERNSFKFDLSCDNYVFQNQGAEGLSMDFMVRDHDTSSNSATPDSDCGCVSVNQMAIRAPQWFSFVPVAGSTYTTPTTMEPGTSAFPTETASANSSSTEPSGSEPVSSEPMLTSLASETSASLPSTTSSSLPVITQPETLISSEDTVPPSSTVPPATTAVPLVTTATTRLTTTVRPATTTVRPATTTVRPVTTAAPAVTTVPATTAVPAATTVPPATTAAPSLTTTALPATTFAATSPILELAAGRRLLQWDDPTTAAPAAYLNGRTDPSETVMWGSTSVSVRSVSGQQALSFTFNGPFTAFHYDPFVAEATWDVSHVTNGAPAHIGTLLVGALVAALSVAMAIL